MMPNRMMPCALLALLLAPLTFCDVLPGQRREVEPEAEGAAPAPMRWVVTLQFRGGTLAGYLEAVRDACEGVNILIPTEADQVPVPAVSLVEADVDAALNAIEQIVADPWRVRSSALSPGAGNPVFAVRVEKRGREQVANPGSPDKSHVRVLSLRQLLGIEGSQFTSKTVLTAIDAGLQMAGDQGAQDAALCRYHEESGLLFVRGRLEEINIVEQVLAQLAHDVTMAEQRAEKERRRAEVESANSAGGATTTSR